MMRTDIDTALLPHERPATGAAAAFGAELSAHLPVLETERLRLRAPRMDDFPAYAEVAATPRGKYIFDEPSRRVAWLDFMQMTASWLLRGYGLWTVEPLGGGDVLGFVLLGLEDGDHEEELGYIFREAAEGHGYATEAALAARRYAFDVLGWNTVVSSIDHGNTGSVRVAERLGAVRDAAAEQARDDSIYIYRHNREDAA